MPYVVPKEELTIEDLKSYRDRSLQLLERMIRDVGKDPRAYTFRDILPKEDFGWANNEWKITYEKAYTEELKVDMKVPDDKFIVFYGYTNNSADPKTLYVKFYSGTIPIEVIEVESLYSYLEPTGYFSPFGFREGEVLKIGFYGNASGDDRPVLRGVVAELKGAVIGERAR